MKFLITGITGFAGPHLANLLISKGHSVYGLIRNSNGRETDILDVVPEENFKKINLCYEPNYKLNRQYYYYSYLKNKIQTTLLNFFLW